MDDLTQFYWPRAKGRGYVWHTWENIKQERARLLTFPYPGNSTSVEWIKPQNINGTLLWRLAETEIAEPEIKDFADAFGLLTGGTMCWPEAGGEAHYGEPYATWTDAIALARMVLRLWTAAETTDNNTLKKAIRWNARKDSVRLAWKTETTKNLIRIASPDYRPETLALFEPGDLVMPARIAVARFVNEQLTDLTSPQLLWSEQSQQFGIYLRPKNLLGAIWIQFAQIIDERKDIAMCEVCKTWFEKPERQTTLLGSVPSPGHAHAEGIREMSNGHIRPRGKGAWELKYDVGLDPVTGRRVTKYATVKGPKRDAQRELRRRLDAVDQGRHADPGKLTLGAWLGEWSELVRNEVSAKTWEGYTEIIINHLGPALGTLPLGKVQPVHIQTYYAEALKVGRCDGRGGLSPQTICHHHGVLSAALKRARSLRLIVTNPAEDVKRPKVERQEIAYLEPSDAAKLLQAASGLRLRAPIFIALATGLRRGELLALRWSDLDLERGSLTVAQALEQTREGLRFKTPKTKRSRRTITLSPSVVEILLYHKAEQAKERLALGLGRDNRGLVFTLLDGSVMNPKSFSKEFARLVKKTGIRRVTFHGLRHTHFTNLLREGVHPKIASERAGHASVAITMDVYSHAIPSLQEDAALRIDGALRQLLEG